MRVRYLILCAVLSVGSSHPGPGDATHLRVRLHADAPLTEATVLVRDAPLVIYEAATNAQLAVVPANVTLHIEGRRDRVHLRWSGGGTLASYVSLVPSGQSPLTFASPSSKRTRTYRGYLTVDLDAAMPHPGLLVVNVIDLESYITGVIPAEYPFKEFEGVKAQAVVSRTYALAASRKFGSAYDLTDHTASQMYTGVDGETEHSRQAVAATRGEILTYGDHLIEAVYFSSSGGHTADNETAWVGRPMPYLRGKPDPYDQAAPHHRWSLRLNRNRVLKALSRSYGMNASGFLVTDTSPEGRVTAVTVKGKPERTIRGTDFRRVVDEEFGPGTLKSTFFDVRRHGNAYVFEGRGFGHGVGLNQHGARSQALAGRSYEEILSFYYTGARLESLESTSAPNTAQSLTPPMESPVEPQVSADPADPLAAVPVPAAEATLSAEVVTFVSLDSLQFDSLQSADSSQASPTRQERASRPSGRRIGW